MFRVVLSIYLMLATLLSPGLCCCTAARLTALIAHPIRATAPRAASPKSCSCRHKHHSTDRLGAGRNDSGRGAPSHGPTCPCQRHHSQMVPLLCPPTELVWSKARQLELGMTDLTAAFLPSAWLPPCRTTQVLGREAPLHFVSARDILRAFHILRC